MWWKIYFWTYFVVTVLGVIVFLSDLSITSIDLIGLYLNIVPRVGIFAYVFKKNIFPVKVWKILFWILVILIIEGFLSVYILPKDFLSKFIPFIQSDYRVDLFSYLLPQIIVLPALYAVYKLSSSKRQ